MRDHDIHGLTLGNPRQESIEKHEKVNFLLRNAVGMLAADWRCLSRLERSARLRAWDCRQGVCAKNGERRYVCGFLVGGWSVEAREWGSVGKPDGALRRKSGASVNRAVLCAGMGERRYRRSAFLAQGPSWAREKPGCVTDGRRFPRSRACKIPMLPDSGARDGLGLTRSAPPRKSPGRTTGALSERYISFVDSSFSSTHSFSRMTGFLSTRPSRSAGTR